MTTLLWKLAALAISWILVCAATYEHDQRDFAVERAQAQAALDLANQHAKEITDERESTVAKLSVDLATAQKAADTAAKNLRAHLADGSSIMRFAGSCGGNVPQSTPAAVNDQPGTCQLSADVAQSLVDLASRADETANKLNACIQAYEAVE